VHRFRHSRNRLLNKNSSLLNFNSQGEPDSPDDIQTKKKSTPNRTSILVMPCLQSNFTMNKQARNSIVSQSGGTSCEKVPG